MNYHQTTGASDPLLPKAPDQRFAAVASLPELPQTIPHG